MRSSRAIPWAIGLAIIIIASTGAAYFFITRVPGDASDELIESVAKGADVVIDKTRDAKNLAKETASEIKNGMNLNGRITVGKTVISEGNRDITELTVRELTFTHTYAWTHDWAGSTKKLEVKGTFKGKAGYDLTGRWADPKSLWGIDVAEDGKMITARVPQPSILSVEMTNYEIIKDDDGLWNKISKEDRQLAVNGLQQGARTEIEKTGILEEVDTAFMKQIEDAARKSAPSGFKVIREKLP